jgi:hypothetical protein
MKLYLSSTYKDLKDHRAFVAEYLRKNQHQVIMMEEYVARDQLVEFACQGDVAKATFISGSSPGDMATYRWITTRTESR